jgi:plasmid stabilization system protein ParE
VTILFSRDAEDDFRIVVEFLAERNPAAASALADRIFSVIDSWPPGTSMGPNAS